MIELAHAKKSKPARENMRRLRTSVFVAAKMGKGLVRGTLLLAKMPTRQEILIGALRIRDFPECRGRFGGSVPVFAAPSGPRCDRPAPAVDCRAVCRHCAPESPSTMG